MAKQNRTVWITGFAAGSFLLIGLYVMSYFLIRGSFLTAWQNMVGILYEKDPGLCEEIVPYLFEESLYWDKMPEGEHAMIALGYTQKGTDYLLKKSGWDQAYIGMLLMQAALLVFLFYLFLRRKKQRMSQEEALCGDIRDARKDWKGLKPERYPFFGAPLICEISDTLGLLCAKEQYLQKKNSDTQMFIENVAHQIKTPLSCISISLDLALEEADDAQKERILECFSHLGGIESLMKRLLNIGRLEAGKIIMRKEPFGMEQLLEECRNILPDAEQRIIVSAEKASGPVGPFYGDFEWLKEAFLNILKNCLEHDKSGLPVQVLVSRTAEGMKITVRDHGPGIFPQDLPYIFDRFYIPHNAKKSHSGIGLNLARLIIERHFGVIHAANHEEGGAVFAVVLPVYALKNEKL